MGLLASGQSFLQGVMESEAESITYTRGVTTIPLAANPDLPEETGLSAFGDGSQLVLMTKSWAFTLSQLAGLGLPQDGDVIQWVQGSTVHQWTVRPDPAGKVYDELDNRRLRVAVNTVYDGVKS